MKTIAILFLSILFLNFASHSQETKTKPDYLNPELPIEVRVNDIISHMTIEEKVSQMLDSAKPIEHLGVPEYNWWNECLHGVARAGTATVFPQSIGLAATFNTDLISGTVEFLLL